MLSQVPAGPAKLESSKESGAERTSKEREITLGRVRGLCEELSRFEEKSIGALSVAKIADFLWLDDQEYARNAFKRALELLKPKSDASQRELAGAMYGRSTVVALIAKHDPKWAKQLLAESNSADASLVSAYQMLQEDPDKAAELAQRNLSSGVSRAMPAFLRQLRQKNQAAADQLFMKTLAELAAEPVPDAQVLMLLGTYVFTSPSLQDSSGPGLEQTAVGPLLVPNISVVRRDISIDLVRAYLTAASAVLNKPAVDPNQKALSYALAHLLLPMVERFSPDLLGSFFAVLSTLSDQVPPEITTDSAYQNVSPRPVKNFDDVMKEIDGLQNEVRRNERYFSLYADQWRQGKFDRARIVASKITDTDVQAKLLGLIEFGEAAKEVEKNKAGDVLQPLAFQLRTGLEKALLMLAISKGRFENKDRQASNEALVAATNNAESLTGVQRAYLKLAIASQLVSISNDQALAKLADAVREFNAESPESIAAVDWSQRVDVGATSRRFPLTVKGVDLRFETLFSPFIKVDAETATQIAHGIKSETLRSDAFVAIAGTLMGRRNVGN